MNQEHISRQFDADLEGLRTRVLAMGGVKDAIEAGHGRAGIG